MSDKWELQIFECPGLNSKTAHISINIEQLLYDKL